MGGVMKPMGSCAQNELKFDLAACDLQLGGIGLEDLPESCIALVLSFLSPRDIAISACTNRALRNAPHYILTASSGVPSYEIFISAH